MMCLKLKPAADKLRSSCVASRKYLGRVGAGVFSLGQHLLRHTHTHIARTQGLAEHIRVMHHLHYLVWCFRRNTHTHGGNPRGSKGAYDSCKTQRHRDLQSATTPRTPEHTLSPRRQFSPRHASAWVFPVSSPRAGGEKKNNLGNNFSAAAPKSASLCACYQRKTASVFTTHY